MRFDALVTHMLEEAPWDVKREGKFYSRKHALIALVFACVALGLVLIFGDILVIRIGGGISTILAGFYASSIPRTKFSGKVSKKSHERDAITIRWDDATMGCWTLFIATLAGVIYFIAI